MDFVMKNNEWEWVCPNCNTPSAPSLRRCSNCQQSDTVDFRGRKK
jgi:hypothetical protein